MANALIMPQLSGVFRNARIVRWLCEEGQSVREGDEVLQVATPTTEIRLPVPFNGVVKEILVDEGDDIREGDILALLE